MRRRLVSIAFRASSLRVRVKSNLHTASEQSAVYFEFYSSVQGKLYRSSEPVPFAVDRIYGSPDVPDTLYNLARIYRLRYPINDL